MSRTKALENVKLTSFDDLFGGKNIEKAAEAGDVIRFRFVRMRNWQK